MGGMFNMSPFQLGVTLTFGVFVLIGFVILGFGTFGLGQDVAYVRVWGTMTSNNFEILQKDVGLLDNDDIVVNYVQKDSSRFNTDLVNALARGEGPDVFFLPHKDFLLHKDKIAPISYDVFPRREFVDTFVAQGQLFLAPEGIYAVPITIDPMVLYWNTRLFSNAGISQPPRYWDEFYDLIPRLTVRDADLNIRQSAFALGEVQNVSHATDILSGMFLQNNIPLYRDSAQGRYEPVLYKATNPSLTESVVNYYTQFVNPSSDFYTWNRSLPSSREYFIQDDLGVYLGFASELSLLRQQNPNLRFDVGAFPQARDSDVRVAPGRVTGLAITNQARDRQAAYTVIRSLTSPVGVRFMATIQHTPAVRPDAFVSSTDSQFIPVFQQMALWARGWLEPDTDEVQMIFRDMVERVTSGRARIRESVDRSVRELRATYDEIN